MLEGKKIIIFGSSGLIGRAVVQHILDSQGHVIAADIAPSLSSSSHCEPVKCDITSESEVEALLRKHFDTNGIVNCAYPRNKEFGKHAIDASLESFNENVSLQLGSAFNVLKQAAKHFQRTSNPMSVVSLSSIYGVVAPKFSIYKNTEMTTPVEYAAVKSSLIHLTKYFAKYIQDSNFRVNCISPGGIEDNQPKIFQSAYKKETLGKGMLSAKDLCGAIEFLLSDSALYVNGNNIIVDDGFSL